MQIWYKLGGYVGALKKDPLHLLQYAKQLRHLPQWPTYGAWRSLVAHLLWEQGVAGSNPVAPTYGGLEYP